VINNHDNRCFISIASIWEIVIKLSLNKLDIKGGFQTVEDFLENNDFEILPIDLGDTKVLLNLKFQHRDPFDRILIAQAINSNLTIISRDKYFAEYDANLMW